MHSGCSYDNHEKWAPKPDEKNSSRQKVDDHAEDPENGATNTPSRTADGLSLLLFGLDTEAPCEPTDDPAHTHGVGSHGSV